MRRAALLLSIAAALGLAAVESKKVKEPKSAPPPKVGVKTPGVQIPMALLKPDAEISASADALLFGDSLLILGRAQNAIQRVDAKTNQPAGEPMGGLDQPCGGFVNAFGSLWVPNCGKQTLSRLDPKTGKVAATIEVAIADRPTTIVASPDSLWLLSDERTTLSRIDPIANTVVAEVRVEAGCTSVQFGGGAIWLTCPGLNKVIRVDPRTNLAVKRIEVAAKPIAAVFGEGSLWVLCQTDGKVSRIDPKTDKVTATIELAIPNADGSIAAGEGSIWVSAPGFPLSRIHPGTDKVVQQFTGESGAQVHTGLKSVWLIERKSAKVLRFDPKRIAATLSD